MGHGLNLQHGGSTVIWMSLPWSLELYQQANARLWRQGQKDTVVIFRLIAEGTIDRDVARALEKKDVTQEALMQAVKARVCHG
jgi:SNF2 family DNA or RNA helicase